MAHVNLKLWLWECPCMYICITYIRYIHACMHACIHASMHPCIHAYIHAYINAYMHTYMHTCIHTCIHAYIHAYIHPSIHPYIHTSIHPSIHTYINTCVYGISLAIQRRLLRLYLCTVYNFVLPLRFPRHIWDRRTQHRGSIWTIKQLGLWNATWLWMLEE